MGYTTDFSGKFNLNKPLTPEHAAYLSRFSGTRRMQRNATIAAKLSDPLRKAVKLPIGTDGEFYVGSDEIDKTLTDMGRPSFSGQGKDASITDYNRPPSTQPGLWCQWVPSEKLDAIEWAGNEKFYAYTEWLEYIIQYFLQPWHYSLSGSVSWQGEESNDQGVIIVENNVISVVLK
jgi:hypothetical protein